MWNQVKKIPKGKTASYKYIAKRIGKSIAYREIANACSKNSFLTKVPYHTVITENEETIGYFNKKNSVIKRITLKKESIKWVSHGFLLWKNK